MLLGTFDFYVLALMLIFNFGVWKYKIIKKCNWIVNLVAFLLFGLLVPVLSMYFEIQKVTKDVEIVDNFTLLYTYFRFPTWWFIGILEMSCLKFILNKTK
jgi:hypothetical protein